MNFDFGMVSKSTTEVRQSPMIWLPGVDAALSLQIDGTGTLASPTMELYENGNDVSSTKLTGSMSIPTGSRTIVCKSFSDLVGGNTYKYYVRFTDDGLAKVREGMLICPKLGVNPSSYPGALNNWRVKDVPITVYPSQTLSDFLDVEGEGTLASVTMYAYRKTTDVSSTVLSGSATVSGRRITLKSIGSLTSGDYLIYIYFTDGGVNTARYFEIICPKLGT